MEQMYCVTLYDCNDVYQGTFTFTSLEYSKGSSGFFWACWANNILVTTFNENWYNWRIWRKEKVDCTNTYIVYINIHHK